METVQINLDITGYDKEKETAKVFLVDPSGLQAYLNVRPWPRSV